MVLSDILEYLIVIAVSSILYIALYKHYAKKLSWKDSFKGAGGAVFVVILILFTNPLGQFFLFSVASYIILTLKDLL